MYLMNTPDRIESFARRKCPRAILTSLLDGEFRTIEEFRCIDIHEKPFYVKTVRNWVAMLESNGYLQSGIDMKKDMRKKQYRIPKWKMQAVEDLLRRVTEDECQRLQ